MEIMKLIGERRTDEDRFVKWWRKEEDFLDYDLIDRFLENSTAGEEIGGIELLTLEEMWEEVKRVGGTRVNRVHDENGDRVEWLHKAKDGMRSEVCMYTPEMLMTIFDVETRGNPVDS
jgi:hypothetical protein